MNIKVIIKDKQFFDYKFDNLAGIIQLGNAVCQDSRRNNQLY